LTPAQRNEENLPLLVPLPSAFSEKNKKQAICTISDCRCGGATPVLLVQWRGLISACHTPTTHIVDEGLMERTEPGEDSDSQSCRASGVLVQSQRHEW